MRFFAHSLQDRPQDEWELLIPHLVGTAERAAEFGDKFGSRELAFAAGLLHDLGKYQEDFQLRIRGDSRRADHAAHGAIFASGSYGDTGKLISHGIAGHHTGLADNLFKPGGRLDLMKSGLEAVLKSASGDGLKLPSAPGLPKLEKTGGSGFQVAFLVRMLFSCLVDADYLATEDFYVKAEGRPAPQRGGASSLQALSQALEAHLSRFSAATGDVNSHRKRILEHALSKAGSKPGVFTLTVPTGGGKTLTSLAFALQHAKAHALHRVVVAIPFTSVIEQTAQVYREALAPHGDAVLEHHSAFDLSAIDGREARSKLSLAMENWDVPLVVTTSVRLFESLFSNRPAQCRKLHNLARSVIILDEVQTLPLELLRPCVAALKELAANYGCSIVLCTATQPALLSDPPPGVRPFTNGFEGAVELAPDPQELFAELRRVRVETLGVQDDKAITTRLSKTPQALCIVNSRAHAQALFAEIASLEGARHLSTLMCAAHRREVLAAIREDLRLGRPCRVVSTSLIEAGVDVDFPVVLRAEAGLDSILQAAGRCNREGRRSFDESITSVFRPAKQERPRSMRMAIESGEAVFRQFEDVTSLAAVEAYFGSLFGRKGDVVLDARGIIRACQDGLPAMDFPFARIASDFRMIDDHNLPLIIQWNDQARQAIVDLRRLPDGLSPGRIARRLQPYTVGLSARARSSLLSSGAAEVIAEERYGDQFVVLVNEELYRQDIGQTWSDPTLRSSEGLII